LSEELNKIQMRGDRERLRELILECQILNTMDVRKLSDQAVRVWSYARSLAKEIGMPLHNGPVPTVCKKAGGDCSCGGQC
jgi:hypothetical protein